MFYLLSSSSLVAITPFVYFNVFIISFQIWLSSKQFCKKIYNWPCLPCLLEKIRIYKNLPIISYFLYWQIILKSMCLYLKRFNKIIYFIESILKFYFGTFFFFACEVKKKKVPQRKRNHAISLRLHFVQSFLFLFGVAESLTLASHSATLCLTLANCNSRALFEGQIWNKIKRRIWNYIYNIWYIT